MTFELILLVANLLITAGNFYLIWKNFTLGKALRERIAEERAMLDSLEKLLPDEKE